MRVYLLISTLIALAVPTFAFAGSYDDVGAKAAEIAAKPKPVKQKKCYDDACRTEQWMKNDPMAKNGHTQTIFSFRGIAQNRDNLVSFLNSNNNEPGYAMKRMVCEQLVAQRGFTGYQCSSNSGQFSAFGMSWYLSAGARIQSVSGQQDGLSWTASSKIYTVVDDRSGKKVAFRIDGYDINQPPTIKMLTKAKLTVIEANLPQATNQAAQYLNADGGSNLTLSTLYRVLNDLWQGYAEINSGGAFDFAQLMITDPDTTSEAIKEYFRVNAKK